MSGVRKDSGGEILASLSLLHSGSVPSFSEVTPGSLTRASLTASSKGVPGSGKISGNATGEGGS